MNNGSWKAYKKRVNKLRTLVLNVSYMPISIVHPYRAASILAKGNATLFEEHKSYPILRPGGQEFPRPSIITVPHYIDVFNTKKSVAPSRENIYKRDGYECVYCGSKNKKDLTLDHVVPRSKGGKDTWENLVTACSSCNSEKGDLDVLEWTEEHPQPRRPHVIMLMTKGNYEMPTSWHPYLFYTPKQKTL